MSSCKSSFRVPCLFRISVQVVMSGHRQRGDMGHFLNILKNVSLAGACLMTMGVVIPQIGPS